MQDPIDRQRDYAADIVHRLREAGHGAFWVGGCVRDLIRDVAPEDYDIVTSARPEEVRGLFSRTIPVGERFGICLVVEGGAPFEVAAFRTEADYDDGRHPSRVAFGTAKEDVRRRDFTINGLLMDPETGRITDHVGGLRDIEQRIIRTIGDPEERFAEDHLRMLRAVRFAATLGFEIEPMTFAAVRRQAAMITRISAERIRDELSRLLTGGAARRGLELLSESGLLGEILPEVHALQGVEQPPLFHPEGDVWAHTLRMVALLPRPDGKADPRLAWAVLLHDVGKGVTRSEDAAGTHFYGHVQRGEEITAAILRRLRFSREEMETILALVRGHMLFMNVREMRPNRLKRLLRTPDFALHLELHRLDCLGSHGLLDHYTFCKQKLEEYPEEELRPPRLLTGRDLIGMGFAPGPVFKEILRAVEDAQLGGEIPDAAAAGDLVRMRWGDPKRRDV
ncbi:MAG: phosphohydrolase [Syntrophobacterales bacterium CG_4_8_14_3_um_filter_58_8]|nr:MAG: phosphohydrolase [Syntrophobacterales bacterium CG_4_8_14_3_um_filter_58_8]